MATLEETLRALCEKHGLDRIDTGFRIKWGAIATVWWNGGTECETGYGSTCAEALASAITKANAVRAITPEVPGLEIGEVPA